LAAEGSGLGTADPGVDLVEDQGRPGLFGAGGELEGEVDARQLAAGGDAGERPWLFARVGGEEEDDLVDPLAAEVDRFAVDDERAVRAAPALQAHGEPGAAEPQISKLALDALDERPPPLLPLLRQGQRGGAVVGQRRGDLRFQLVAVLGVPFELGELGLDLLAPGEDRAGVAAVLAAEPLEQGEALFDLVQPGRVGLQAVEAMAEGGGELGDADADLVHLGPPGRGLRLPLLHAGQKVAAPADPFEGRALVLGEEGEAGAEGADDRLGMAEDLALGPQPHLLAGAQRRSVDLAGLKAEEVETLAPRPVVAGQALEPLGEAGMLVEGGGDAGEQGFALRAAATVDQAALQLGLDEAQLVALAMDAQQEGGEIREQPERRRLVVDEHTVPAAPGDLA